MHQLHNYLQPTRPKPLRQVLRHPVNFNCMPPSHRAPEGYGTTTSASDQQTRNRSQSTPAWLRARIMVTDSTMRWRMPATKSHFYRSVVACNHDIADWIDTLAAGIDDDDDDVPDSEREFICSDFATTCTLAILWASRETARSTPCPRLRLSPCTTQA
jgi:hypothetical protein